MNNPGQPPPLLNASRSGWRWGFAALLGALAILFFFNPVEHDFFPQCHFHQWTGWDCPGCGGLRATHELLHGHVRAAFAFNPLLFVLGPVVGTLLAASDWRRRQGRPFWPARYRPLAIGLLVGAMVTFGLLRNISPELFPPIPKKEGVTHV